MSDKRFVKVNNDIFDRDNSTVIMDDFQIKLYILFCVLKVVMVVLLIQKIEESETVQINY